MEGTSLVRLLVAGSTGQLARALRHIQPDAIFLDRSLLDLSHPGKIAGILASYSFDVLINAAAYTNVDKAEAEEKLAFTVNADSVKVIAQYCARKNIPFISFSSDYVFDGSGNAPWKEEDKIAPLNAYGRSKAAGEKYITEAGGKYFLFRTSWVFDAQGKNFFNTILRLVSEREELRIINDQFGAPTYAPHLAKAVLAALDTAMKKPEFPSGIYHLCNAGVTTWYGFASLIVEEARKCNMPVKVKNIIPIPANEYPLPAKRPFNSRLDCSRVKSVFNITMPNWSDGVKECVRLKNESI